MAHGLAQQVFFLPQAHLHPVRNGGAEFKEPVIDEGHPHLQRVAHADAVGAGEDILRQIGLDIAVEDLVQGIVGIAGVEVVEHQAAAGVEGIAEALAVGEQAGVAAAVEAGEEAEIALARPPPRRCARSASGG